MASTLFQSAQRIISQILQFTQSSGQDRTANLIKDTFNPGIDNATLSGEGFLIIPGGNNTSATPTVSVVTGGIAYDNNANRIFISSSDFKLYDPTAPSATTNDGLGNFISTPQSTGVINVPVTQSSQNYIWIDYLATIDTNEFTLNKETNAKQFYAQTDGYNISVTIFNVPPTASSIFLGSINMTGGGAVQNSNISQVGRTYYTILPSIVPITTPLANASDRTPVYGPASTYTLEAHIKSVGTGTGISPFNPHNQSLADFGVSQFDTVQAHRQLEHGNAIIAGTVGNSYPSSSAMACTINIVNPGSDYITVHQLLSSEYAIVNGTAYNVNEIFGAVPTDASVFFPASSGIYNLYWDSNAKVFGVTTASIASDVTKLWLCTVTYTYVGALPADHNSLSVLIERRRIGSTIEKYQRWVTSARPPVPLPGEYGFNLTINAPEYFDGLAWQSLTMPTGSVIDFAGATAPIGFLVNDGTAISRTTYANLFSVIGITFGPGDGSTTFNLPNKQRRVSVGAGGIGTGTLGNTVGSTGGAETVASTQAPHSHAQDPHNHVTTVLTIPGQIAYSNPAVFGTTPTAIANDVFVGAGSGSGAGTFNAHNTSSVTATNNSTTAVNNASSVIQPSIVFTSIIKY